MSLRIPKTWQRAGAALLACAMLSIAAPAAFAAGPAFRVYSPAPATVLPGEEVDLEIAVQNVGDTTTSGPITMTYTVGAGLVPPEELSGGDTGQTSSEHNFPVGPSSCATVGSTLTCIAPGPVPPGAQLFFIVKTEVEPEAAGAISNSYVVSGGGAASAATGEDTLAVGPPGPFGFTLAAASLLNADGTEAIQAASSPADFTTKLKWNSYSAQFLEEPLGAVPVEKFKDVTAHLPPGLVGNPSATPALCTPDELAESGESGNVSNCPLDSQIGLAHIYLNTLKGYTVSDFVALYNMVAPYGVSAELGFQIYSTNVLLYAYVRPGDHGIDIVSRDTSTSAPVSGVEITVWGDPADPRHDPYRGECLESAFAGPNGLVCPTSEAPKAFLRNPTSCSGKPLAFGIESNSYEHPEDFATASFDGPTMSGCDLVPFDPSIAVTPTGTAASSPTGVDVKLSLPQTQNPDGLQEADLKKAVVTLPEGMVINPSAADGLQACTDAQLHLDSNTPAECPDGSKIGTVLLHTQLIPNPIEGNVYLRTQSSNDPMSGEMFRIVIELRDDAHGLDFKIPGQIRANPQTGRLTTTFDEDPQFPFEDISLKFKAGARAPLATPASCQTQTTEADLYSWSEPDAAVHRASSFALTSGPEGTPCVAHQGFAPGFNAGVTSVQAGGFTPFLTTFTRKDADQSMQRVSVQMPEGLLGSLVGLPLCGEAQANAGTCSQASEIGTVTAGVGAGPTPFYVTGGKVFMTGPYEGAPFGLSVVVPAKAGPFDLGTVVVRAKVEVDVHTAQLTVTTDPLPQIVGGVPVNLRLVNVTINRPKFTYNPTDCDPSSVTGTITGGQGGVAYLESHFQVTNCGALKFQPNFKVSTSAKTSRRDGASLHVVLTYPENSLGKDANIQSVHVELPKALPSRLSTLNHACLDSVFDRNPAACPPESRVGFAKAVTPVLPVPLNGPAYFVSHGGQKFPELIVVLQGYGVTVDLQGETFISKAGVTSSTFRSVPDVPVSSFELTLPEGKYSALAANRSLCAGGLTMPSLFTAQDGNVVEQKTPVEVEGCSDALAVRSHRVRKRTLILRVYAPSAGRLKVSGRGIQARPKRTRARRIVTLRVHERKAGSLARLRTKVSVAFTPRKGKARRRQVKSLTVKFRA